MQQIIIFTEKKLQKSLQKVKITEKLETIVIILAKTELWLIVFVNKI